MTPHLDSDQWPILLSEPVAVPERVAAEAHAAGCATCESDREAAARLLSALLALPSPPPPSAEALHRASAPILAQLEAVAPALASSQGQGSWLSAALEMLATAAAAALVVSLAAHRADPSAEGRWALGAVLLALALSTPGLVRRLGWTGLALAGLGAPLALLQAGAPELGSGFGSGWSCAASLLLAAALPPAALLLQQRLSGGGAAAVAGLRLTGAVAAGALAGQAALAVTCPSDSLSHLLVYHLGLALLATVVGGLTPLRWARAARRAG